MWRSAHHFLFSSEKCLSRYMATFLLLFFPFLLAPVEKGAVDFSGDVMIDFKHCCGHRANLSNVAMPYLRWESICSTDRKVVISRLCYLGHIRVTHVPPASNDSPLSHGSWQVSHAAQVDALACGSELDRGIPWSLSGAASSPGLLGAFFYLSRSSHSITRQMGRLEQQGCFCTFLHDTGSTFGYKCSFFCSNNCSLEWK